MQLSHDGFAVQPHKFIRYSTLKYVIGIATFIFCLVNVFNGIGTSGNFSSSHEYFRADKSGDEVAYRRINGSGIFRVNKITNNKSEELNERLKRRAKPVISAEYPPYNVTVDGEVRSVPLWQRRIKTDGIYAKRMKSDDDEENEEGPYYFLVELLQVRIYAYDKARWSIHELKQWMHYLFLSGVEHIYLCDHYMYEYERIDKHLARYIELGLITYLPWGDVRDPMKSQIRCYQRIINRYKMQHRWHIAIDMDEYPFSINDTSENYLIRYLENIPEHISEISMPTYHMLGQGDRSGLTVIERINRMTQKSSELVKPIYRPQRVHASVHHNHILSGTHITANPLQLKMLHYWGARSQSWGPDTAKTIAITTEMNEMRKSWTNELRNSLIVFGESDSLTNLTGL